MITDERESQVYPGSANDTARETVPNIQLGIHVAGLHGAHGTNMNDNKHYE